MATKRNQKFARVDAFARVEYNVRGDTPGTSTLQKSRMEAIPAHPAFKEALEALPPHMFLYDSDVAGTRKKSKGLPWGVPAYISISPVDVPLLGLPLALLEKPARTMGNRLAPALLLVTKTRRRGELPEVVNFIVQKELAPGRIELHSSLAYRQATHLDQPYFWRWRCFSHEDCKENPELGQACCATRAQGMLGRPRRLHA